MVHWHKSISFSLYFMLNLIVTFTNKQILVVRVAGATQRPYLLTALHGMASFIGCTLFSNLAYHNDVVHWSTFLAREPLFTWRQHAYLALFSLFYTVNIALSNLSLALVSLPLNQNIRATAPVLTLMISVLVLRKPLQAYSMASRLSLVPITLGVILAASGPPSPTAIEVTIPSLRSQHDFRTATRSIGIMITFLGALTAVLKTIFTHKLMTSLSLNLSPLSLLQILSPYAALQALTFAYFNGELNFPPFNLWSTILLSTNHEATGHMRPTHLNITVSQIYETLQTLQRDKIALWLLNAIAAFLLNLASFEANKSCGPISMAVAANLKQIAFLVLPVFFASTSTAILGAEEITRNVIFGTVLTVSGGIWYAWEMAKSRKSSPKLQSALMVAEKEGSASLRAR